MTQTIGHEGAGFQAGHPEGWTLDRWRTGELAGPERERVAAHLAGCEACARTDGARGLRPSGGRVYAADRALAARAEPDWMRVRARIAGATGSLPAPAAAGRWRKPSRWGS